MHKMLVTVLILTFEQIRQVLLFEYFIALDADFMLALAAAARFRPFF